MNHYLIIGRIIGDDEDTPIHIQAPTVEEACAQYRDEMYEMEGWGPDEIGHAEANGEGVAINHAFRSAAPMYIDFPRYPQKLHAREATQ